MKIKITFSEKDKYKMRLIIVVLICIPIFTAICYAVFYMDEVIHLADVWMTLIGLSMMVSYIIMASFTGVVIVKNKLKQLIDDEKAD